MEVKYDSNLSHEERQAALSKAYEDFAARERARYEQHLAAMERVNDSEFEKRPW